MIIGVYGTIGSGKTTISNRFKDFNFKVIECDSLAREIVDSKQFQKTIKNFFPQCFVGDVLDRSELRNLIAKDENQRLKLNSIVWPEIKNQIIITLVNQPGNYVIDGALLPELDLKLDHYIEVASVFMTAAYRILRRDHKSRKQTLAIYLKQKKALKKFANFKRIKINNNFWNPKFKTKRLKKLIEKLK